MTSARSAPNSARKNIHFLFVVDDVATVVVVVVVVAAAALVSRLSSPLTSRRSRRKRERVCACVRENERERERRKLRRKWKKKTLRSPCLASSARSCCHPGGLGVDQALANPPLRKDRPILKNHPSRSSATQGCNLVSIDCKGQRILTRACQSGLHFPMSVCVYKSEREREGGSIC